MQRFSWILGIAILLFPFTASAQFYAEPYLGGTWQLDTDSETGGFVGGETTTDFRGGFLAGTEAGYQFNGFAWGNARAGLDLSYRNGEIGNTVVPGGGTIQISGEGDTLAALAVGSLGIDTGTKFEPYVRVGLGLARHSLEINSIGGAPVDLEASDTVLAAKAGIGVAYGLNETMFVTLGYDYVITADATFEDQGSSTSSDYTSHSLMVGFRVLF